MVIRLRGNTSIATGPVVNDDLLAPALGQLLADQAGQDIGGAPGRIGIDHADRPVRVGLLRRGRGG